MAAGKVYNLLLGHTRNAVVLLHLCLPVASVDERVDKGVGTALVLVERVQIVELHVVDDCRQQLVAELATLKLLYLGKYKALNLVECLTLVRHANDNELRVVAHVVVEGQHTLATHRLIDVDIK